MVHFHGKDSTVFVVQIRLPPEAGIHTQDDVTWIKHECAERHHELKYDSGYSEAHDRTQSHFDGAQCEDNW